MTNKPVQEAEAAMPVVVTRETPEPSQVQVMTYTINERQANAALLQLKTAKDGSAYVVRYSLLARILHFLLLVAVTGLAFTGLAQILYGTVIGGFFLRLLGGLDETQGIHHAFALLLAVVVVFHVLDIMESLFVRRQVPAMLPVRIDFQSFMQKLKFDLGVSKKQPRFGRYSFEEKAVYWLLSIGVVVLGLTGVVQLFPIQVTEFLPGISIPASGIIHRWEAILVMVVVFIWHFYQVLYRKMDVSIFSGKKSLEDMQLEHPLELEYLQKAAAAVGSPTWPVKVEVEFNPPDEKKMEPAPLDGSAKKGSE